MQNLLHAIKDWPVLIQGAVGSGLFWLFLVLAQKVSALCSARLSAVFKKRRKTGILNEFLRVKAATSNADATGGAYAAILWFRASRDVIKGLIWLALGLSFDALLPVLGIIGFIGSLFYFFAALNAVRPFRDDVNLEARAKELEEQLTKSQKA